MVQGVPIQGKSESLLLLSPSLSPGSVDCIIQPAIHISNESPAAVNNENCSYSSLKLLEGLGNVGSEAAPLAGKPETCDQSQNRM